MLIDDFSDIETLKRKNINLSSDAWKIIDEDMQNFMGNTKKQLSTFLNKIFISFYQEANASIYIKCNNYKKKLINLIGNNNEIINKLIKDYENTLINEIELNKSKNSKRVINNKIVREVKFKLNNENFEILKNSLDIKHEYYNNKERIYLNALFEEYTKLNGFEREKIYFKDYTDNFLIAKDINNCCLNITLLQNVSSKGFNFTFIPEGIYTDDTKSYMYFAGGRVSSDGSIKQISFRANRIAKMGFIYHQKINKKDIEGINQKIKDYGVMYLAENIEEFKVKLTPKGIELYNRTLNMRPNLFEINDNIYTFKSTSFQIKNYFFKFGCEAELIYPLELRETFIKEYENAIKVYKK